VTLIIDDNENDFRQFQYTEECDQRNQKQVLRIAGNEYRNTQQVAKSGRNGFTAFEIGKYRITVTKGRCQSGCDPGFFREKCHCNRNCDETFQRVHQSHGDSGLFPQNAARRWFRLNFPEPC
jgi:hypothetical protein